MIDNKYPILAKWVKSEGDIELGENGVTESFIRVLNEGGMLWESKREYKTIDEAFRAAEKAIQIFLEGGWPDEEEFEIIDT